MTNVRTRALEAIEAAMAQVPQGSYRWQVLAAARDFKHAWFELGSHLVKVRDGGLFAEWGYDDFDAFVQKELHIKKATAHKLCATFAFMERHEPSLVEEARSDPQVRASLPPFEVVQVLSKAEENGQIDAGRYQEVRGKVFDERPPTPQSLSRTINQSWPPPPPPEPEPQTRLERLSGAARRLAAAAERDERVPPSLKERAAALADDFDELVEQAGMQEAG